MTIDFGQWIRPGDVVLWGQASAEPVTLVGQLLDQRARFSGTTCFIGIPAADTVRLEHADHLRFVSYCGTGSNRALGQAGRLDIQPTHYSSLVPLAVRPDVVVLQVAPADENGCYSLGLAHDYAEEAIDSARVVIVEVNDQVPQTYGSRYLTKADVDVIVHTSTPPAECNAAPITSEIIQIGNHVADLVEDGSTLQFGIGSVPEAVLGALTEKNDLGIHSGVLSDAAVDLTERGVVTNACKTTDRGISVATVALGTRKLFTFVDRNRTVGFRPLSITHDPNVLAMQNKLVAINSAIEVDLTGQVNTEVAGGVYVGAVGGGPEFLRGAARSRGGIPIVALPSTVGRRTRIVNQLSGPVSTSRCDAGVIVTEFGVADLRGLSLSARRERMIAIAHPDHRDALASGETQ